MARLLRRAQRDQVGCQLLVAVAPFAGEEGPGSRYMLRFRAIVRRVGHERRVREKSRLHVTELPKGVRLVWSVNIRRGRAVRTVLRRLLAVWPIVSCWRWGASGLQRVKRPEVWSTQRASATPKRWAMAPRDSAPRPVRRSSVHAVQYPVASYAIRIERYDVRWAKFLRYAIRIERYET